MALPGCQARTGPCIPALITPELSLNTSRRSASRYNNHFSLNPRARRNYQFTLSFFVCASPCPHLTGSPYVIRQRLDSRQAPTSFTTASDTSHPHFTYKHLVICSPIDTSSYRISATGTYMRDPLSRVSDLPWLVCPSSRLCSHLARTLLILTPTLHRPLTLHQHRAVTTTLRSIEPAAQEGQSRTHPSPHHPYTEPLL